MAEHVAGTAMMVVRISTAAIGIIPGTMPILNKLRYITTMLRLAYGRLPAKTGRKQGRQ